VDLLMVFVTLGTQDKPFERLLEAVDKQIKLGNIKDEVIVQSGSTRYNSDKMKIYDYMTKEEFDKYIEEADIIITHAGVGTIVEGLKKNKKVIAAARKEQFGEHVNDHQEQILENFSENKYILKLVNFDELDKVIKEADEFEIREFETNQENFIIKLDQKVKELLNI